MLRFERAAGRLEFYRVWRGDDYIARVVEGKMEGFERVELLPSELREIADFIEGLKMGEAQRQAQHPNGR